MKKEPHSIGASTCLSEQEFALIREVATHDGMTMSKWIRSLIIPVMQERLHELTPEIITMQVDQKITALKQLREERLALLANIQSYPSDMDDECPT